MRTGFVLCTNTEGAVDLDRHKVYAALEDKEAARSGMVRIVDESGEDYLYPIDQFEAVQLNRRAARALQASD